jgi:hypothetical protein
MNGPGAAQRPGPSPFEAQPASPAEHLRVTGQLSPPKPGERFLDLGIGRELAALSLRKRLVDGGEFFVRRHIWRLIVSLHHAPQLSLG